MPPVSLKILSPTIRTNALGRGLAMHSIASQLGPTQIFALSDGPMWSPASQFGVDVAAGHSVKDLGKPLQTSACEILWLSKGWGRMNRIARQYLDRVNPEALVVLDLDDDDEALSREFANVSLKNKILLNRTRKLHPARIRRSQTEFAGIANGYTFSTLALADRYRSRLRLPMEPMVRVPHARQRVDDWDRRERRTDTKLRVATLGTIRSHKGLSAVRKLAEDNRDIELHIFSGGALDDLASVGAVLHSPGEPLADIYREIDVAFIPMSSTPASQVQLPAKLIDAMASGVPIVATRTLAIEEVAGDSVNYVGNSEDTNELRAALFEATVKHDEGDLYPDFLEMLTPQSIAERFASLAQAIIADRTPR